MKGRKIKDKIKNVNLTVKSVFWRWTADQSPSPAVCRRLTRGRRRRRPWLGFTLSGCSAYRWCGYLILGIASGGVWPAAGWASHSRSDALESRGGHGKPSPSGHMIAVVRRRVWYLWYHLDALGGIFMSTYLFIFNSSLGDSSLKDLHCILVHWMLDTHTRACRHTPPPASELPTGWEWKSATEHLFVLFHFAKYRFDCFCSAIWSPVKSEIRKRPIMWTPFACPTC